jgi:hypothetical protein
MAMGFTAQQIAPIAVAARLTADIGIQLRTFKHITEGESISSKEEAWRQFFISSQLSRIGFSLCYNILALCFRNSFEGKQNACCRKLDL